MTSLSVDDQTLVCRPSSLPITCQGSLHPVNQDVDLVKAHVFAFRCKVKVLVLNVVELEARQLAFISLLDRFLVPLLLDQID